MEITRYRKDSDGEISMDELVGTEYPGLFVENMEFEVTVNDDESYDAPLDGVTIELSTQKESSSDGNNGYRSRLQVYLTWEQIEVLQAYLAFVFNHGRKVLADDSLSPDARHTYENK
jgi:hypothetical protein